MKHCKHNSVKTRFEEITIQLENIFFCQVRECKFSLCSINHFLNASCSNLLYHMDCSYGLKYSPFSSDFSNQESVF